MSGGFQERGDCGKDLGVRGHTKPEFIKTFIMKIVVLITLSKIKICII